MKAIYEAYEDPSLINIAAAGIGLVPGVGDLAGKGLKAGAGPGNIGGGATTAATALDAATTWLGQGYRELAPGVFRSADDARQFRMTTDDLVDPKQGPHVHFEAIGPNKRTIIENSHIGIMDP